MEHSNVVSLLNTIYARARPPDDVAINDPITITTKSCFWGAHKTRLLQTLDMHALYSATKVLK